MTTLEILGSMLGVVLIVATLAFVRRSRKTKEPIQLGVDKYLRP